MTKDHPVIKRYYIYIISHFPANTEKQLHYNSWVTRQVYNAGTPVTLEGR